MPAKRYPVLLEEQRECLISIGKDSARKLTRARILLKADCFTHGLDSFSSRRLSVIIIPYSLEYLPHLLQCIG